MSSWIPKYGVHIWESRRTCTRCNENKACKINYPVLRPLSSRASRNKLWDNVESAFATKPPLKTYSRYVVSILEIRASGERYPGERQWTSVVLARQQARPNDFVKSRELCSRIHRFFEGEMHESIVEIRMFAFGINQELEILALI